MTETQKYLYADSDRQTERVNQLEWQVFTIFSICNFMIVFVAFFEGIQDSGIYRDDFSYFGGYGGGYADRISAQARQQQDPLDITGGTGAFDTVYDHCL